MRITFLGTSGAFPTATRNATAHLVHVQGESILLDCGEGTQQQLHRCLEHFMVQRIFLSHLHQDHVLGLPGYLWTMDLLGRSQPLEVYVPPGCTGAVAALIGAPERLQYPLRLIEVGEGTVVAGAGYQVTSTRVHHHGGPSLGFRIEEHPRPGRVDMAKAEALGLQAGPSIGLLVRGEPARAGDHWILPEQVVGPPRPGRSVVYSGDTRPCENLERLARGADLLIHESMFLHVLAQEAASRGHSTSADAASIAHRSGVSRLALTHLSQRHQDAEGVETMLREAQAIFPNAFIPLDLDHLELPLHE